MIVLFVPVLQKRQGQYLQVVSVEIAPTRFDELVNVGEGS